MTTPETETRVLLEKTHAGDSRARHTLVQRNLQWIESQVRKRLGAALRKKADTLDFVQEAVIKYLDYGPRFVVSSEAQFRALMARIVENLLRDQHDYFNAQRRARSRERELKGDSVLYLDPPQRSPRRPSEIVGQQEEKEWLDFGLGLLPPDDRDVIWLRQWEGLSYDEVGERLGCTGAAARMRFKRALPKLARIVEKLKAGELDVIE